MVLVILVTVGDLCAAFVGFIFSLVGLGQEVPVLHVYAIINYSQPDHQIYIIIFSV